MTLPRQFARLAEFADAEVAAANPHQRDQVDSLIVVEIVDQFAQFRLGRVVTLIQVLLAVLGRVGRGAGIGLVRKFLEIELAGLEDDVANLVEANIQFGRLITFIDHWTFRHGFDYSIEEPRTRPGGPGRCYRARRPT